jgi:hypothetical protein
MTEKKNPDYSASAVNLTNPPEVQELLMAQRQRQTALVVLCDQADACVPAELKAQIAELESTIAAEQAGIKGYIDTFGSYQNLETGMYGVKQRRESVTYSPELMRKYLDPKIANLVIVESVDTRKLDGLIKGGFVTPEEVRGCGEAKESFAYIIR